MSSQPILWEWDQQAGLYYYLDPRTGHAVYRMQDGSLRAVPRTQQHQHQNQHSLYHQHQQQHQHQHQHQHQQPQQPQPQQPQQPQQTQPQQQQQRQPQPQTQPTYLENDPTEWTHLPHENYRANPPSPSTDLNAAALASTIAALNLGDQPTNLGGQPTSRTFQANGVQYIEAQHPISQVRTRVGTAPANLITDPTLYNSGVHAHRLVSAADNAVAESLYGNYRVRSHDFFTLGRVFMVLWAEPAGENGSTIISMQEQSDSITPGILGGRVFSKVRRFVVIRPGRGHCSALPISTYGGRGVSKPGLKKSDHAIIYSGRDQPSPRRMEGPGRGEEGMRPHAIRVVPDERTDALDPMSRLDFAKVHTINHNIKVRPYGNIHPASMEPLWTQFNNVWFQSPTTSAASPSSSSTVTARLNPLPRQTAPEVGRHAPRASASTSHASSAVRTRTHPRAIMEGDEVEDDVQTAEERQDHDANPEAPEDEEDEEDEESEDDDENADGSDDSDEDVEENAGDDGHARVHPVVTQAGVQVSPAQTQASSQRPAQAGNTQMALHSQATGSSTAAAPDPGSWALRVQQARNAIRALEARGLTREQAFRMMCSQLEQQGKSAEEADAEVRALLTGTR